MKVTIGFVFLLFYLFFCGCNFGHSKPAGFPDKLFPCEIIILQEGVPLRGAYVVLFDRNAGKKNWGTSGITGNKGAVKLYTYGRWQGAPAGVFKVTVLLREVENAGGKSVIYTLVDEKFAVPETTPLELEIKGKTTQTFDVGKAIRKPLKDL
ncbi:MAG: hypothetical protein LBT09_04175 [Planctomycetaceae bacterium]|jgi:hypothetical protein|nr:hypothetical protein [Planctomycetaceae bacterium]